ncbi:MAG: D-aminoacyl-tRNA deacylase [Oligoflexia bacterium]|nr:D-aminoacyl-tRNA deacylase [Oligoflexia bacterium]
MKAIIQRVKEAAVTVEGQEVSRIDKGILTFLGIAKGDTEEHVTKMIRKICELRIFEDDAGKMNLSLQDIGGQHLLVSQFTLVGDCNAGRRPSFTQAERPEVARQLYDSALAASRTLGVRTAGGVFQANMSVSLVNDGPVTFIIEK